MNLTSEPRRFDSAYATTTLATPILTVDEASHSLFINNVYIKSLIDDDVTVSLYITDSAGSPTSLNWVDEITLRNKGTARFNCGPIILNSEDKLYIQTSGVAQSVVAHFFGAENFPVGNS